MQIGYNDTPYVSPAGFYTAVWAILLNTIIGPVIVGIILKYKAQGIGESKWGFNDTDEEKKPVTADDSGRSEAVLEDADR